MSHKALSKPEGPTGLVVYKGMRMLVPRAIFRPCKPPHYCFLPPLSRHISSRTMRTPWTPNCYPAAFRSEHYDEYESEKKHGKERVHDPYNWLEHNTEETEKWTTTQVAFTREYLDQNPDRQKLEDEIRRNTDYAKVDVALLSRYSYLLFTFSSLPQV